MRISRLIEELETYKNHHGDLDVVIGDSEGWDMPIGSIELNGSEVVIVCNEE